MKGERGDGWSERERGREMDGERKMKTEGERESERANGMVKKDGKKKRW